MLCIKFKSLLICFLADFKTVSESKDFSCMSIDEVSKDAFWMVAKCDKSWPKDFTYKMCTDVSKKNS